MMAKWRPLLLPGLCTLIAGALLISLGAWQLHRLAWKEGIIARIEARTKAAPQPLPPAASWEDLKPDDYDYRRVAFDGIYRSEASVLVFRPSAEGPGYLVLTPLDVRGLGTIIVNRGFIPSDLKAEVKGSAAAPSGEVHVTGLMRPPESRNLFTPADEPAKGRFFTRDPQAIAAHLGLADAAPFTIDADATPQAGHWPRGGATQLSIPNNHLSYALTWFGLALGLIGVFATFAWRRLAQEPVGQEPDRKTSEAAPTIAAFRR